MQAYCGEEDLQEQGKGKRKETGLDGLVCVMRKTLPRWKGRREGKKKGHEKAHRHEGLKRNETWPFSQTLLVKLLDAKKSIL